VDSSHLLFFSVLTSNPISLNCYQLYPEKEEDDDGRSKKVEVLITINYYYYWLLINLATKKYEKGEYNKESKVAA